MAAVGSGDRPQAGARGCQPGGAAEGQGSMEELGARVGRAGLPGAGRLAAPRSLRCQDLGRILSYPGLCGHRWALLCSAIPNPPGFKKCLF